jgi:hypothetical protein
MTRVNRVLQYLSEHASSPGRAMDRADILNDLAAAGTMSQFYRKRLAYEDAITWVVTYYRNIKTDEMGRIYMAVSN